MSKEICEEILDKESENYKFFNHRECEYFPCHDVKNEADFNCLFCYCPLYVLKDKCGGNFTYLENGVKDCSDCMVPHRKDAYDHIISKCKKLVELAKK